MIFKGAFGLIQKPETQKVYTIQETADLLDASCDEVRKIIGYRNIKHQVIRTRQSRAIMLDYDAVRLIKEFHDAKVKKREEAAKHAENEKQKHEEEVCGAEDHPLVKDKRFLKLSYFPDVVPDCFKECEE